MNSTERRQAILTLIAAQLQVEMADRALKQYVVALDGHLSPNTVRRILEGKDHRISTLADLADSMGCDLVIEIKRRVA